MTDRKDEKERSDRRSALQAGKFAEKKSARCRFEKMESHLRFHFLLCRRFPNGRGSLPSNGETAHFTRLSVQTIYAASAAEEGGGQHVAEENSQLRGIERIDCEGE